MITNIIIIYYEKYLHGDESAQRKDLLARDQQPLSSLNGLNLFKSELWIMIVQEEIHHWKMH